MGVGKMLRIFSKFVANFWGFFEISDEILKKLRFLEQFRRNFKEFSEISGEILKIEDFLEISDFEKNSKFLTSLEILQNFEEFLEMPR